jgi:hypothetical protein
MEMSTRQVLCRRPFQLSLLCTLQPHLMAKNAVSGALDSINNSNGKLIAGHSLAALG